LFRNRISLKAATVGDTTWSCTYIGSMHNRGNLEVVDEFCRAASTSWIKTRLKNSSKPWKSNTCVFDDRCRFFLSKVHRQLYTIISYSTILLSYFDTRINMINLLQYALFTVDSRSLIANFTSFNSSPAANNSN